MPFVCETSQALSSYMMTMSTQQFLSPAKNSALAWGRDLVTLRLNIVVLMPFLCSSGIMFGLVFLLESRTTLSQLSRRPQQVFLKDFFVLYRIHFLLNLHTPSRACCGEAGWCHPQASRWGWCVSGAVLSVNRFYYSARKACSKLFCIKKKGLIISSVTWWCKTPQVQEW